MRKVTKKDCSGCSNDFYNYQDRGANRTPDGKIECWDFKTATLESAYDIHRDARPPYKNYTKTIRPSCYRVQGYSRVKPSSLTKEGYWK